ncbi:hypothetical protein ABGF26_07765 [Helcococcus ovis]|uniref:hypothetical protein n=1 Tax=Helcococcus ovis TaxID=72026 RepID=UPI0038B9B138
MNIKNLLEKYSIINQKLDNITVTNIKGGLVARKKGNKYIYYHKTKRKNGKFTEKYLRNDEMNTVKTLAYNSYIKKLKKHVSKTLLLLKKLSKLNLENGIDEIYVSLPDSKKSLFSPIEPTWEQVLKHWKSIPYEKKLFLPNSQEIYTNKSERVRSKSEKILADYFDSIGLEYKYECPIVISKYSTLHPDFTFLSPITKQEIYWEHFGIMDNKEYVNNAISKLEAYNSIGIYQGKNLIITYETQIKSLNTNFFKNLVNEFLVIKNNSKNQI